MIIENDDYINGTKINYYFVCKTQLWFFSHHIQMEHNSEDVLEGKLLHETSYKKEKEYLIDNKINIDYIKNKDPVEIHEIKKTKKKEKAHKYQLLYYMYYLKKEKEIGNIIGYLNYPLIKEKKKVILDSENEKEIKQVIKEIQEIIKLEKPPMPIKKRMCKNCSYYELCYI